MKALFQEKDQHGPPIYYDQIIGKKVTKNIKKNTPIKKNLVKF